jgi:hypothetical protein
MQNAQHPFEVVLPPPLPIPVRVSAAGLVTCSMCLAVQRASGWIAAEEAIRKLRTYDRPLPVQLGSGICDSCRDEIESRRGASRDALADAA